MEAGTLTGEEGGVVEGQEGSPRVEVMDEESSGVEVIISAEGVGLGKEKEVVGREEVLGVRGAGEGKGIFQDH